MKSVITIVMLILLLVPTGMKLALVAYYQINKDYISSNFCENNARPKMECNGKCFLAKKIKAQEETEKNIPSILKGMEEVLLFCFNLTIQFSIPVSDDSIQMEPVYMASHYKSPLESIFQPPQ